jgi:hypothetical protein
MTTNVEALRRLFRIDPSRAISAILNAAWDLSGLSGADERNGTSPAPISEFRSKAREHIPCSLIQLRNS